MRICYYGFANAFALYRITTKEGLQEFNEEFYRDQVSDSNFISFKVFKRLGSRLSWKGEWVSFTVYSDDSKDWAGIYDSENLVPEGNDSSFRVVNKHYGRVCGSE